MSAELRSWAVDGIGGRVKRWGLRFTTNDYRISVTRDRAFQRNR